MFLLTIIQSPEFITFISGLVIAIIVLLLYNSSYIIKKKTREEAIQRLKLDSIIRIINGTDEFQEAMKGLNIVIVQLTEDIVDMLNNKENLSKPEINYFILELEKKIIESDKNYEESKNIIEKFIFSLERDMIINGEDEAVKEEINKITKLYDGMVFFIRSLDAEKLKNLEGKKLILYVWDNYSAIDIGSKVKEYIKNIWKIYKEKLDKEQEDWLDKLLNCFKRR